MTGCPEHTAAAAAGKGAASTGRSWDMASCSCWMIRSAYSKDDRFRRQVGERKEPTGYIVDPSLNYDVDRDLQDLCRRFREQEEQLTTKEALGHLRFVEDYLMFQYDATMGIGR
ncbi:MAG: hypothetical protein ACLVJ6_09185 [Merdibacter sp.]